MSNFYFCNDCKKPTDLITAGKKLAEYHVDNISEEDKVCFMCWGTNWHAEIDGTNGYYSKIVDDNFKELLTE